MKIILFIVIVCSAFALLSGCTAHVAPQMRGVFNPPRVWAKKTAGESL